MISGEAVSVPRKSKVAIQLANWQPHLFMAGNYFPSYMDKAGSIVRRFAVFPWTNVVKKRDTTLAERITNDELVTVLMRCIRRYHKLRAEKGNAGFWESVAPLALKDMKDEITVATNPMANFIANGDAKWDVIYTGSFSDVVPYSTFKSAFEHHMRHDNKQRDFKMGSDEQPLKVAGFTIEKVNLCKVCGKKGNKNTCGSHFLGGRNRTKKKSITHMRLVPKSGFSQIDI
jgi:hypothetical protein